MAITLPIELTVAPGSTDAAIRKATADAGKALEAAAKDEAKRLAYLDGLRQRYFTDEQRRRDAEVRAEERAQAQMLAAEQRRATQAEALNARVAAAEAAAAGRFEAAMVGVQGAVAGLSSEEMKLQALTKQAAELYNRGAISAMKYAQAVNAIGDRQKQLKAGVQTTSAALSTGTASAGAMGAAMGNLRSQIIDVGVSLQGGANPLTVLSQQGPQIAEALMSAKGAAAAAASAVGSLLQVLAPLALALSPLIVGWLDYAQAQRLATEAAATFRAAQDSTLGLLEKATEDVRELTQIQRGYTDVERQADEITRGYARAREEANAKHQEAINVLSAQLGLTGDLAEVNAELVAQGKEEVKSVSKTSAAWVALKGKLDEHIDAMSDVDRAAGDGAAAALLVIEYNAQQEESEGALAQSIRDRAKADKTAAKDAKALGALRLKLLLQEADAEIEREKAYQSALETLQTSYDVAQQGIATEEERIQLAAQAAREVAVGAANEAQAAAASSLERQEIARKLAATLAMIGQGELLALQDLEAAKAKIAADEAKKRADEAAAAAEELQQYQLSVIGNLQGGLEGIATLIGGPVAGAITGLILDLEDTVGSLKEELLSLPDTLEALPELLTGLVVSIVEDVIPALVEAAPRIAEGFAMAVTSPEFLTALGKAAIYFASPLVQAAFWIKVGAQIVSGFWDAFLQGWESFVSGEMFAGFAAAFQEGWDRLFSGHFVSDLVDGFIEAAKAFVAEIKGSIGGALKRDESGTSAAGDALREIFTLGQAETRFGDTPTPIKWGDRGPPFSPDDWVSAARTREGLERQTGGGGDRGPMTIDLADGHMAFDGQLRRATKQPRTRREMFGFTTARGLA